MEFVLLRLLVVVHGVGPRKRLHPLLIRCSYTIVLIITIIHHSCIRHILETSSTSASSSFDRLGLLLENTGDLTFVLIHCSITSDWSNHGRSSCG